MRDGLATFAMVDAGDQAATQAAGMTVLHLEEAVVAVGLAVSATYRVIRGRAHSPAAEEGESREAPIHGHRIHMLPTVPGLHFTFIAVYLLVRGTDSNIITTLAGHEAVLGGLAVMECHGYHSLFASPSSHFTV